MPSDDLKNTGTDERVSFTRAEWLHDRTSTAFDRDPGFSASRRALNKSWRTVSSSIRPWKRIGCDTCAASST